MTYAGIRILKFKRCENIVKDEGTGFNLFIVKLTNSQGNIYSWVPKWEDLHQIFLSAYMTEYYNNEDQPNRMQLNGFKRVATRIINEEY